MRICVIGDIHGRIKWREINPLDYDLIIFIGDYFDSFHIGGANQMVNFKEIIEFKKTYPNVILLIGNHDCHYLWPKVETYSGFQAVPSFQIRNLLEENMEHLNMCVEIDGYIFSHAGVSEKWLALYDEDLPEDATIADKVNLLWTNKQSAFYFYPHYTYSRTGEDVEQSPIWIRPRALKAAGSFAENYIQVVGHTQQENPHQVHNIIMIDAPDYYTIIDTTTKVVGYEPFKT